MLLGGQGADAPGRGGRRVRNGPRAACHPGRRAHRRRRRAVPLRALCRTTTLRGGRGMTSSTGRAWAEPACRSHQLSRRRNGANARDQRGRPCRLRRAALLDGDVLGPLADRLRPLPKERSTRLRAPAEPKAPAAARSIVPGSGAPTPRASPNAIAARIAVVRKAAQSERVNS